MKIAVLTTKTLHHTWFLQKLMKIYPSVFCVVETRGVQPPFEIIHPFEEIREIFEKDYFFSGNNVNLRELCEIIEVENINDRETIRFLENSKPNILISFGTRKIGHELINLYKNEIVNLHGGDPEKYRGLDSHLWAIYHNDWSALITTLHILNEKLDDGKIIQKNSLNVSKISHLYQLRVINTEACLKLSISALKTYENFGSFITCHQHMQGRYYSFMPKVLKEICVKKFENYLKTLKNEH